MLRISLEILPLAALTPAFWAFIVVIFATAFVSRRQLPTGPATTSRAWIGSLLALFAAPLALLVAGLVLSPAGAHRSPHELLALTTLYTIAGAQLGVLAWVVWQRRIYLWPTIVIAIIAAWWTAGAFFTASMAVTNTWL